MLKVMSVLERKETLEQCSSPTEIMVLVKRLGLQEVKELVTGTSGGECSGRWDSHCRGAKTGTLGMFQEYQRG